MRDLLTRAVVAAAALALLSGPVAAATRADPMHALAGRPAGAVPLDPMAALIARAKNDGAAAASEEYGGLPDGAGAEETYYQCVACHSTEIIKQQRITDHRWDELWDWMIDTQGMAAPDDETKAVILTYLKGNFSSER